MHHLCLILVEKIDKLITRQNRQRIMKNKSLIGCFFNNCHFGSKFKHAASTIFSFNKVFCLWIKEKISKLVLLFSNAARARHGAIKLIKYNLPSAHRSNCRFINFWNELGVRATGGRQWQHHCNNDARKPFQNTILKLIVSALIYHGLI